MAGPIKVMVRAYLYSCGHSVPVVMNNQNSVLCLGATSVCCRIK